MIGNYAEETLVPEHVLAGGVERDPVALAGGLGAGDVAEVVPFEGGGVLDSDPGPDGDVRGLFVAFGPLVGGLLSGLDGGFHVDGLVQDVDGDGEGRFDGPAEEHVGW